MKVVIGGGAGEAERQAIVERAYRFPPVATSRRHPLPILVCTPLC